MPVCLSYDHVVGISDVLASCSCARAARSRGRTQLRVSQPVQHWLDQRLKLLRILVEDGLFGVVGARIVEYLLDIGSEVIHARVWVHIGPAFARIFHFLVVCRLLGLLRGLMMRGS